jgi:hypothetical protein
MIISSEPCCKQGGIYLVVAGLISGFVFLGFGEIIKLLHQMNERLKKINIIT